MDEGRTPASPVVSGWGSRGGALGSPIWRRGGPDDGRDRRRAEIPVGGRGLEEVVYGSARELLCHFKGVLGGSGE